MKKTLWNREMIGIILALAWPTMLEQLMQTAVQYIDTAMVGSLGTYATAAVGATATVNWMIGSTISALGVGFLSAVAKAHGAGDFTLARKVSAQSVLVTLISGIVFTAVIVGLSPQVPVWMQVEPEIRELAATYFMILYLPMLPKTATILFGTVLRAGGDTKTPMIIGVFMNLINVILNFLLIYPSRFLTLFGLTFYMPGAGMGVIGAAVASAIAFTIGGVWITISLLHHKNLSPLGFSLMPDKTILIPCMKTALPNVLQRFTTTAGYVVFASMINALGEVATAAHTVANTVESAFYIPGYGMQTAAATLAGNAYGAGDRKRMEELVRMFLPIEVVLMAASGAALFFSAPVLVGLFSDQEEVFTLGVTVLRMVAVSEPLFGVSIILEGMMYGVGNTKKPFIYNIGGMWGIRILGTFLCTTILNQGLIAAWGCMIAHNVLLFVMYLYSHFRRDWLPESMRHESE